MASWELCAGCVSVVCCGTNGGAVDADLVGEVMDLAFEHEDLLGEEIQQLVNICELAIKRSKEEKPAVDLGAVFVGTASALAARQGIEWRPSSPVAERPAGDEEPKTQARPTEPAMPERTEEMTFSAAADWLKEFNAIRDGEQHLITLSFSGYGTLRRGGARADEPPVVSWGAPNEARRVLHVALWEAKLAAHKAKPPRS